MSVRTRSFLVMAILTCVFLAAMPCSYAQPTTQTFDYQGPSNLGLAPQTPEEAQDCVRDDSSDGSKQNQTTSRTTNPTKVLNASDELDQNKVKCGVLTAAAGGAAGYIVGQTQTASVGAAGLVGGAVVLGGAVALLSSTPSSSDPVPFPIPGAGLLSYLLLGGTGAVVWMRRRMRAIKEGIRDAVISPAPSPMPERAPSV